MALSQSIVWTTLPCGRITLPNGGKALRVSVYVSPRLTPTAQEVLKPFEMFRDWPKVAAALRLKLVFDGGGGGELVPVFGEDPPDSDLWKRLFDADTFVRGHQFTDLKNEVIRSFPVADVLSFVQQTYATTATNHGTEFPGHGDHDDTPLTHLKQELGPLSNPQLRDRLGMIVDSQLKETKVFPPNSTIFPSKTQAAFFQAGRFYSRPKRPGSNPYREQPDPAFVATPVAKPEFDFHQALAAFADYPKLMRRLGLVLDYAWVETAAMPSAGRVRIEVQWGDPHVVPAWHQADLPGWTEYALDATNFRARAVAGLNSELTRGQLDLRLAADTNPDEQKSPYLVAQVDVDGSALKTLHTAGTLVRIDNPDVKNYRTPQRSDLPALRTSGLSLYKRNRALGTHAQLIRASALQAAFTGATRPIYFADDLLRGYRIDVWDDVSQDWHPLCLRNGEYRFTRRGNLELKLRDEGYVKLSSATRGEDGTPKDLYLHERLASFDGWSLVASRPGKTLAADPTEAEPVPPPETAATEFGLSTHFVPPRGTVPRLRYGRNYRLRVRLVDIAGNSIEFKEAGDVYASRDFLFTRFEPVPSPALQLRARVTEGESLEHLVIRSDYDRTTTAYAADAAVNDALEAVRDRLALEGAARAGYAYADANERHVAPPKISQLEAETHGKFDDYIGPGNDHAKGFRLALRESGTFLSKTIVNLATGAEEPIPGIDLEVIPPFGEEPTDLDDPSRKPGDPLKQGEYVLHKEAQLVVPYLADPYASGVAFVGLPGVPAGEPYIVAFDGSWPDVKPFRIRLVERPGVMNQCAEIFAGTGEPQWDAGQRVLTIFQPKGVMSEVRYSSVLPNEDAAKNMGLWKWTKQHGGLTDDTKKAILSGRHWMFTPWRTMTLVHAVQHPLCPPTIKIWAASRNIADTFADLRGHWYLSIKSTAKILVQAAWQEPLDDVAQPTWQILDRSGNVAEVKMETSYSDELDVPASPNAFLRTKPPLRHEFGDTKHRMVRYRLKGTTRFREYFPIEITHEDPAITRTGPEFEISVPSSARPAAAQPLYALPTFKWEETVLPNNGLVRTRRGNGVRVYLERPWWSSGESERLGVVFRPGPVADPDKPYVTQWGLDPVFDSSAPVAGPTLSAFPLASDTRSNVSLEEKGDGSDVYSVAGHKVEYDAERKLWFSDIVVYAGASYFPFIRFALARFQPFSIEDCHLSRVVLMDFVQLVPDRTLDVRWVGTNTVRVKIYGNAPTETFVSRVLGSLMQVRSESQGAAAGAPIKDIVSAPIVGSKALEVFKAGQLEFFNKDKIGINPGVFVPVAEPAEASSRLGLNEYTVAVEQLPDGESPDFGWKAIDGITPTKPPQPPKLDPRITTAAGRSVRVSRKTSSIAKLGATKVGSIRDAASRVPIEEVIGTHPSFEIKPLWEGDITLPPNDNRPRRLVVRENELYFKATPKPGEFLPIARRLVYVDIVNLPAPTA
jgi:hypothetical protein